MESTANGVCEGGLPSALQQDFEGRARSRPVNWPQKQFLPVSHPRSVSPFGLALVRSASVMLVWEL